MSDILARLTAALQDRYAVDRQIGEGGMATVYLAEDRKHRRAVAIKVLRPELAANLGAERFLREIELAAKLQHPHVLPVYDSGAADGILYYVMPFVEGESLRDRLKRDGQLPVGEAVRVAREVASALGYAHGHGIIHRDIKPENILLQGGHAVVADFGIARAIDRAGGGGASPRGATLTGMGLAIGTPAYMSPEQATADEVDARSDQYSLGVVLYEMLAGQPAFSGTSVQSVITKNITGPRPKVRVVRRNVPEALERVLLTAMAKEPAERYATIGEFAEALAGAETEAARAPTWRSRAIVAATALLALAGSGAWYMTARAARGPVMEEAERIAVLPFSTRGAGVDEVMGEGMVDLMSTNLGGVGGIETVEPRTVLARWKKVGGEGGADLERALKVGADLDAGAVLLGSVVALGPKVRLSAELYSLAGASLGKASVDGPADSVLALVDGLSLALMREIWRSNEPVPSLRLSGLTTGSIEAMKSYLRGEQFYRQSEFDSATAAYREAVEKDSTFALAHHRVAMSMGWIGNYGDPVARKASAMAVQYSSRLPAKDRALLVGYQLFQDGSIAAVDSMRRYTAAYPRDVDGWYLLGESMYHMKHTVPQPPAALRAPFDSVVAIDPTLTPAVIHPLELSVGHRDRAAYDRYMKVLRDAGADGEAAIFDAAGAMVWGTGIGRDSAAKLMGRTVRGGAQAAVGLGTLLDPGLRHDSVLAGFGRVLARMPADAPGRTQVMFGKAQQLAAFGRYAELSALADTLYGIAQDQSFGASWAPIFTNTATPELRRGFEEKLARAPDDHIIVLFSRGLLALQAGDVAAARGHFARMRTARNVRPDEKLPHVMSLADGWLEIAAGDTAKGIATMERSMRALGGYNDWQWMVIPMSFHLGLAQSAYAPTREAGITRLRWGFDNWIGAQPHIAYATGRALEAAGRPAEAAEAYARFTTLWATADPALQPRVADARARRQNLIGEKR